MMAKIANGNGGWQKWVLGIGATIAGTIFVNTIVFQREARKDIAENNVKIEQLAVRDENIIKFMGQRLEERLNAVQQALAQSDAASDQRLTERMTAEHNELMQRDATIQRLEKRIEELERRAHVR